MSTWIWVTAIAGGILGAGLVILAAWLGACWWFGDRHLFAGLLADQRPAHRAGDEPRQPEFVTPSLVIPPNLFPRQRARPEMSAPVDPPSG